MLGFGVAVPPVVTGPDAHKGAETIPDDFPRIDFLLMS